MDITNCIFEADGNGKKLIGPSNYLDSKNVKTFVKFLGIFLGPCLSLLIHTFMS